MSLRILHYSDVENAYDDPDRIGRLAGALDGLDGEDALVVGTGDNTSPGVLALATEGRQALDFFDAVDPDVATFGNHDFDHGPAPTRAIVADSPQTWVTANVRADGERFAAAETRRTAVVRADGTSVGFTGVTTPRTTSLTPEATGLTFADPVTAATDAVADLRERGVDHVVVLSHLGRGDDDLARAVDADVVLGGHVPTGRIDRVDGTLVTRPGDGGEAVVEVDLGVGTATRHETATAPRDDAVARALDERMAAAGLDEVVARVDDPLVRTEATLFGGESRVGNFVADAYRWATGADVALQNSGGIRSGDPVEGTVTVADLVSLLPFEEPVAVAELSGTELRRAFEQAVDPSLGFAEEGWFHAHVSGAELAWNPETGDVDTLRVDGDPLDPAATYTLATSDYVLHTDDEFPAIEESQRVSTGRVQYETLVEYARETGIDPSVEDRIAER
ncbi:bifunctional metallophosphatase/5'-nucleotidase [Halomicrococcus gelatinilyticus]|uniref:bifunctional metallophosphatase/5'-nucleotidase n=1 Tax=Halomicrococcus gelatinilyticus TaxID=1702103 RepID=UPI002E13C4AB